MDCIENQAIREKYKSKLKAVGNKMQQKING